MSCALGGHVLVRHHEKMISYRFDESVNSKATKPCYRGNKTGVWIKTELMIIDVIYYGIDRPMPGL